jgi:hypothetical protein
MRLALIFVLGIVEYTLAALILAETIYTLYEKFEVATKKARWFNDLPEKSPLHSLGAQPAEP